MTDSMISNLLRELPPELDAFQCEAMRAKARKHNADTEAFGHMSDEWIANELRGLMRNDLYHEAFCTAGRDRVMRLSMQLAEARGVIQALKDRAKTETTTPRWVDLATELARYFNSHKPAELTRSSDLYLLLKEVLPNYDYSIGERPAETSQK
jgi:N-acyl-D-aspartate/D-glutamate deacylase